MKPEVYHTPSDLARDIKEMSSLIKQYKKSMSLLKKIDKADHLDSAKKVEFYSKVQASLASTISGIMSRGAALGQGDLRDHDQMGEEIAQEILSR
jgi:ribosome-binding protein aMBF1 (putative translation factor)